MLHFSEWSDIFPYDLYQAYEDAYGAVIYGVRWTGHDVEGLSKDEALEYAADFMKKLAGWRSEKRREAA